MFPVVLQLSHTPVLLAGRGELLQKRLAVLDESGAGNVAVFCDQPTEAIRSAATGRLIEHLPSRQELENYTVIMVAGLPREEAEAIAVWARELGRVVNVEDVPDLCDFYCTSYVRRGDLLLSVSTSGASPTLARQIRNWLALHFGPEWAGYTQELGVLRKTWKAQGVSFQGIIDRSEAFLAATSPSPSLTLPPQGGGNKDEAA